MSVVTLLINVCALLCYCPVTCVCLHVHALVAQLVERSPRMWSVVGLNPTQGSFFFEKRESCPGCISLPLLGCHVNHSVCITASLVASLPLLDPSY